MKLKLKGKLKKSLIFALIFGIVTYVVGIIVVIFTQLDGAFETSVFSNTLPLALLAVGLVVGFIVPRLNFSGKKAAEMPNQIPEEVKKKRREEVMALSESLIFADNEERIGQTMEVMIEGQLPEEHVYVARTFRDAPEIDGYLFFKYEGELMSGDFRSVTVTGTNEYDLIGEVLL